MTRSNTVSKRREARHLNPRQTTFRILRGGLLVFVAGALAALAGTPANLQEALQAQRSLVAKNPRDADLLNDLGNLLALAGDFTAAEETYRRALEIDPGDVTSLYNLALAMREQDDLKGARQTLQTILELEPQHAWSHYQLGTLYEEQQNRSKAVHHYARAFAIDRSLTSPKVNPHIVENRLATDALLTIYVEESPSTQAPRLYEEPGDVADLLMPPQTSEPAAKSGSATVESTEVGPGTQRLHATFSPPAPDGQEAEATADDSNISGSSPESARTIDAATLGSQESGRTGSAPVTPSKSSGGGETRSSPTVETVPAPDSPPTTGGTIDAPRGFAPGLQSTGRLDLQLLPAAPADAVTSTT